MTEEEIKQHKREVSNAYALGLAQGKRVEREWCALLVEQLGIEGYGTLAIAAAIRERDTAQL